MQWGGNNLLITSNKFLKISSLLDFCLFDCCHLSPRLRIQWRRWYSTSLGYLDAIFYLRKERALGEGLDSWSKRDERVVRGTWPVIIITLRGLSFFKHLCHWRFMIYVLSECISCFIFQFVFLLEWIVHLEDHVFLSLMDSWASEDLMYLAY